MLCPSLILRDARTFSTSVIGSTHRIYDLASRALSTRFWVAIILLVAATIPASAQLYVDDEFSGVPNFGYELDYPGDYLIQTFTVHHNGPLVSVGVQISQDFLTQTLAPPVDDLHVRLVRTDSQGVPLINEVLAAQTIDRSSVPLSYDSLAFSNVDLSSWNVFVHAGDVLGIAVTSDQAYYTDPYPYQHYHYLWHGDLDDPHPGGGFYVYSPIVFGPAPFLLGHATPPIDADAMGYRVILNTPEPASIWLLAIAMTCLAMYRHCSKLQRVAIDRDLRHCNE